MKPFKTKATNRIFGKPENWDESLGPCVGLPAIIHEGCCYSYWSVSWKERLKILFGSKVELVVAGAGMPPVALEVKKL